MAPLQPIIRGALAGHPAAADFAREVARVHRRYAAEVVGAFSLCPFMKDPDSAFGHFCVMLDWTPDGAATLNAVLEAQSSVIHLIFPCVDAAPGAFDRFAGTVRDSLAAWIPRPPVMAVFHPEMNGDFSTSHRLVGLLRRAPDPFIQLVPEGLHEGGTIFIDSLDKLSQSPTEQTFARLTEAHRARLVASLEDVRRDRMTSYPPHIEALRAARSG